MPRHTRVRWSTPSSVVRPSGRPGRPGESAGVPRPGVQSLGLVRSRWIGALPAAAGRYPGELAPRLFLEIAPSRPALGATRMTKCTTFAKVDPSMAHEPGRRQGRNHRKRPPGQGRPAVFGVPVVRARPVHRLWCYTWAFPTTLVGLTAGVLVARHRRDGAGRRGALEFHGGLPPGWPPVIGFDAMTLGHVILGRMRFAWTVSATTSRPMSARSSGGARSSFRRTSRPACWRGARRALLSRQLVRARCPPGVRRTRL